MPRPIHAHIHPQALRHNLGIIRQHAPDANVWAVVKANAYGHGLENVFEALRGADGFALLDLAEAQRIRNLGWRGPILLLEGVFEPRDLELCSRLGLWHTVHCPQQIDMLAAHKTHTPHRVFLKLNSGMNRLGFAPQSYRAAWARLNALPQVDEISLMMHFSDADRHQRGEVPIQASQAIESQLAVFHHITHDLPGERTLCNSAAVLRLGPARNASASPAFDWVRAGIALYGSSPDYPHHHAAHWQLQPAMSLRSKIIATQQLLPGETVGYGSTFTASAPMRIGIAACGYADGYPRICPTGTPVLVDGIRCATVGRISMDMLAIDLEPALAAGQHADFGSEVTLWGQSASGALLPIDEVAACAQTIGYELMCAIAPRVPVSLDDAQDDASGPSSMQNRQKPIC